MAGVGIAEISRQMERARGADGDRAVLREARDGIAKVLEAERAAKGLRPGERFKKGTKPLEYLVSFAKVFCTVGFLVFCLAAFVVKAIFPVEILHAVVVSLVAGCLAGGYSLSVTLHSRRNWRIAEKALDDLDEMLEEGGVSSDNE
jgi:hypothetical protein